MALQETSKNLKTICKGIGFFLMALTLIKFIGLIFIDEKTLELLKWTSITKMADQSRFCSNLALAYFFLFLSELIGNEEQQKLTTNLSRKFCHSTIFLLLAQTAFSFFTAVKTYSKSLILTHGDTEFFFQLLFTISIDVLHKTIPLVLAIALYKFSHEYDRLTQFEKEVI